MTSRRAVIVGGGISGLTVAHDLWQTGWTVEVHEAASRWGGKIGMSLVGDRLVDDGPDGFLNRVDDGVNLARDLGLADEICHPATTIPAYLVRQGHLYELPASSMLGVPTDLDTMANNGVISAAGVERARFDLTAEATPIDGDISIGALCRHRLGDEITDRLIDPLLGGINASDIDRLSLRAGAPLLAAALEISPSLIKGLAQLRPPTPPGQPKLPIFAGLNQGTYQLVEALVNRMSTGSGGAGLPARAKLHLNSPVTDLKAVAGDADAVIVTVPSNKAAPLIAPVSPLTAEGLATIEYASVTQVMVELPRSALGSDLDASGILFPPIDGTLITATTWMSSKWTRYRRDNSVLVRMSTGRFGDERHLDYDDDKLVDALLADLGQVIEIKGRPIATRVNRFPQALPQYTPGHQSRVDHILAQLAADAPNVHLTGLSYRGIGIPACIQRARQLAHQLGDQD